MPYGKMKKAMPKAKKMNKAAGKKKKK